MQTNNYENVYIIIQIQTHRLLQNKSNQFDCTWIYTVHTNKKKTREK